VVSLRAVTFDYWDTLYEGASEPARKNRRRLAVHTMLAAVGCDATAGVIDDVYHRSSVEADRWWREEQRGYSAEERIRWMLARLSIDRPADCAHVAAVVRTVDEALLDIPPALFSGAARMLGALADRVRLGIISDTGFASGRAQDALLEQNGLRGLFAATIYSADVGRAKPRPEPFRAAIDALGVDPAQIIHVGDNERTDVGGALAAGMRAVRVDIARAGGTSSAEFVARSMDELEEYLVAQTG
jgi:putative hydrolase of the HAD superfamily